MKDKMIKSVPPFPKILSLPEIGSRYREDLEKNIKKRIRDYDAEKLIRKEGYGIAHPSRNFFVLCEPNGNYIARIIGDEEFLCKLYNDYIDGKIN